MQNTTTRNATFTDLRAMLERQEALKVDVPVNATKVRSEESVIRVSGVEPVLNESGVTEADGLYVPTKIADEQIATRLGIPRDYLKRLRETRPDLYDANVNGWLHGRKAKVRGVFNKPETEVIREAIPGDDRTMFLRMFKPDDLDETGILRSVLSDRYGVIDHLDALTAAIEGVNRAGVQVVIDGADLTERRMMVRVSAPQVTALAPTLLAGYRSPFTGESGSDNPVVFAGFVIANSETGNGAFTITPRITVQVCKNGMTVSKDAMRAVHLGGKMEEGVIRWSGETQRKQLDLITSKTTDAVATFLDADYMRHVIAGWEAKAGEEVRYDAVDQVMKPLGFSQEQRDGILDAFVRGGQMTLGGVANAVTAFAQTVEDGDLAYDLEARAMAVLA